MKMGVRGGRIRWRVALMLVAAAIGSMVGAAPPQAAATTAPAPAPAAAPEISLQSVETTAWPVVRLRVVLPARMLAGALAARDFSLRENGALIEGLKVRALQGARLPLHVVLVIDTSGSMKGQALEDAKQAALRFVVGLAATDRVAVLSFSDKPSVEATFTSDRAALMTAVGRLGAQGRTALNDALVASAEGFGASPGTDRAVVLLSDGSDTVSGATADVALRALSAASAPVYAVAIKSADLDVPAMRSLANASGGRLIEVGASTSLAAAFGDIATELTRPYEITYTSLRPPAKDLDLDLLVTTRDGRASLAAAVPNPDTLATASYVAPQVAVPSSLWPFAIALLVFAAVGAMVAAILVLLRPEPNALGQLAYYEQLKSGGSTAVSDEQDVDPDSVQGRLTRLAGSVAARGGFEIAIRHALELAGLPLRPVEYMTLHASLVLVLGVAVQVITGEVVLSAFTVLLLTFVPVMILVILGRRRQEAFQEQLPDVLNLLASSLRAGWGLLQATGIVVNEMGPPVGPEFERVVTEARLGLPLEDALAKMADRMASEDFKWAVSAIAVQREVGGNLAEVLDLVAETVRERASLRRQIKSLTSEGRLSAYILIALPFLEAIALYLLNPSYFGQLLSSTPGMIAAGGAVVLLVIGIVWLQRIVNIEV
jgi:tight adherence protein B